jgi:hypothetical protein
MTNNKPKKLSLTRVTLRTLNPDEMQQPAGGFSLRCATDNCPSVNASCAGQSCLIC